MENYASRFHFFTNEHKELDVKDLKELFKEYDTPHDWEKVIVYLGKIEIGVLVGLSNSFIGICQYGLCTFADTKSEMKGLWIESHVFDEMIKNGTSIEKLLEAGKEDIECQISNYGNTYDMHGYSGIRLNYWVPFSHPLFTLQEMVEARKAETRIIFWRPKANYL